MNTFILRNFKRKSIFVRSFSIDQNIPNIEATAEGPLAGYKILDMTRVLAGPFASMILGDLGATVIKIERPGMGDETRSWGPPFVGPEDGKESCYFLGVNRNKASVAVNLKSEEGAAIVRRLATKCDVLFENFLPGTLERQGLGYDSLKGAAPHLIYCALTGYGRDGPYSKRPGYDVMAASVGGLMGVTGHPGGAPAKVGVAMTDLATGLYCHGAILAAILHRQKTGQGQRIDVNLLSSQVSCMVNLASSYLNAGIEPQPWGTQHASIVPYQAFATQDGHISIAGNNDGQFAALCRRIGREDLLQDTRYATNGGRVSHREVLIASLSATFLAHPTAHWLAEFEGASFPYAPINRLSQTFADPQVRHNDMVKTLQHSRGMPVKVVGPAVTYSECVNVPRSAPPALGQHTATVLRDLLGHTDEEIESLHNRGVVQCA